MSTEKITVGADPELFIVNRTTRDVVSSIGLIPGVKNNPYIPQGYKKGYGIETDNISSINTGLSRLASFMHVDLGYNNQAEFAEKFDSGELEIAL